MEHGLTLCQLSTFSYTSVWLVRFCFQETWITIPVILNLWQLSCLINSLRSCGTIWCQRFGSNIGLTAPSPYLNQCWLITSKVTQHSLRAIFQDMLKIFILNMSLKNINLRLQLHLPGSNQLILSMDLLTQCDLVMHIRVRNSVWVEARCWTSDWTSPYLSSIRSPRDVLMA